MKTTLDFSSISASAGIFSTSSTKATLTQLAYTTPEHAVLYLDDTEGGVSITDTSGNSFGITPTNVFRRVHHSDTSKDPAARFYGFSPSNSYIRVDNYALIGLRNGFTLEALSQINGSNKQILIKSASKDAVDYALYYESGFLWFTFVDIFGTTILVKGPAITTGYVHAIGLSFGTANIVFGLNGIPLTAVVEPLFFIPFVKNITIYIS